MNKLLIAASVALLTSPSLAQEAPMPLPVQGAANQDNAVLRAGTEIMLRMTQEVTTRGNQWSEGDTFVLTVAQDVTLGDYVVIPRDSRAVGRITWLTDKGMFGKSGKMDIEIEYVEVMGRRIDLEGTYRQEGEGNTLATVGGVIMAGPFAAFITGRSGRIPQGRELSATLERDLELAIPASEIRAAPSSQAPIANAPMPVLAAPSSTQPETENESDN